MIIILRLTNTICTVLDPFRSHFSSQKDELKHMNLKETPKSQLINTRANTKPGEQNDSVYQSNEPVKRALIELNPIKHSKIERAEGQRSHQHLGLLPAVETSSKLFYTSYLNSWSSKHSSKQLVYMSSWLPIVTKYKSILV